VDEQDRGEAEELAERLAAAGERTARLIEQLTPELDAPRRSEAPMAPGDVPEQPPRDALQLLSRLMDAEGVATVLLSGKIAALRERAADEGSHTPPNSPSITS
jgi:hypothetical protein